MTVADIVVDVVPFAVYMKNRALKRNIDGRRDITADCVVAAVGKPIDPGVGFSYVSPHAIIGGERVW